MGNESIGNIQDFEIVLMSKSKNNSEPVILTSTEIAKKWLLEAMQNFDASNQLYSAYLKDDSSKDVITPELLDELADSPQTDLNKILRINQIIRKEINKDDIIGKTVESIETNVNTDIKLSYNAGIEDRNKLKKLEEVKSFVDNFNEQIKLKNLLRSGITTTYAEGTYIMYLRHNKDGKYKVDYYPLGVAEISDYEVDGEPVVLFNINELRNRLFKIYKKTKKNKALFFDNIEEEVKANYPDEVYEAFKNKEQYAKLDVRYTGVVRIGNLNRKYGLSPIFRSLKSIIMLDTFENSDRINSKAKAKKIIFQKLRKETMGTDYNKKGFEEMAYAHDTFMKAWKQPTVVVTAPPQVESIEYIEPQVQLTDINTVNHYRAKALSTLGIGFLMDSSSQTVSTANISVDQLLRTINKISEQFENVLHKWYRQVFIDNNIPLEFCPKIQIIDSEVLDFKLRKELATTLFTIFNGSMETSLGLLGIDVNDEKAKRMAENEQNFDEIFYPRNTAYTFSGKGTIIRDNKGGRPEADEENNKTIYDDEYNKTRS